MANAAECTGKRGAQWRLQVRALRRHLALMWTLALIVAVPVGGCGPVEDAVGSLLQPMQDKVTAIIDDASAQGQVLLMTSAGQVDLALDNFESSVAADLHRSIKEVDDATRRRVEQLQDLVATLETGSAALLTQAIDGSQQLINSLPFTNKNPQVRGYTPRFVNPRSDTIQVQIQGNFVWAMEAGKQVTLRLGSATYSPNENTTNRIGFAIPSVAFPSAATRMSGTTMELNAPYEKGKVFKKIEPGVFHLLVTTLPPAPLTELTVTSTRSVSGVEELTSTAPAGGAGWRVQSWKSCNYESDLHNISADPGGWQIVPSTVTVHYLQRGVEARGKASTLAVTPLGFVAKGETWPNCDPTKNISFDSGDITYEITYKQVRPTSSQRDETVDLLAAHPGLTWGDQLVAPVASGSWTLHARLWDGSLMEARGTDSQTSDYLKVKDQGDAIAVSIPAPDDLA